MEGRVPFGRVGLGSAGGVRGKIVVFFSSSVLSEVKLVKMKIIYPVLKRFLERLVAKLLKWGLLSGLEQIAHMAFALNLKSDAFYLRTPFLPWRRGVCH